MRVIVGVNDTDQGMETLEEAVERARKADHEMTVAVYSTGTEALEEIEAAVRDQLEELGFDAEITQIADEPGSKLTELAERENFDEIILPGGNRSPLGKIQLDSTIEFVLLNAQTSIKLIR
jgi:nucleotide-binding universal stress UspA family protein